MISRKINDRDSRYIRDIINNCLDSIHRYEVNSLLSNICVEYIKTDNIEGLEFMLNFNIASPKYTKIAIIHDKIDTLKYLYDMNHIYLADICSYQTRQYANH